MAKRRDYSAEYEQIVDNTKIIPTDLEDEMKKSKEEIFYDNYRIHFYVELRDFLMSDNDLDDEYYEKLASEKDSLLALLYDDFLDREYSSINNWEDTTDFLESYCERYYENTDVAGGTELE